MQQFAEQVMERGSGFTDELTCLTKSGALLAAEMSASIVSMDDRTCLIASVRDVTRRERLARDNDFLRGELAEVRTFGDIVGESAELRAVLEQVERVAPTDASGLIPGGSGTGKELVARAIHERSRRSSHALVRVNCPSIPADLFESEFFGHVRGAFTGAVDDRPGRFEVADGGTMFLDEVGEIPLALQSKLLRVLQEGQFERVGDSRTRRVDVRIIAATNRDLRAEAAAGRFRQDLFYRLSVFPIDVPPLRERRADIRPLAEHFVGLWSTKLERERPRLTELDFLALEAYGWPGNVRELQNVLERAVILSRDGRLALDLGGKAGSGADPARPVAAPPEVDELTLDDVARLERDVIARALERSDWKIYGETGAAALLDLKPTTLASRMKKMGLRKRDLRG